MSRAVIRIHPEPPPSQFGPARLRRTLASLLKVARLACFVGFVSAGAAATTDPVAPADSRPAIQVVEGGWGGGEPAAIREVLQAVVEVFPAPRTGGASTSIRVRHRFGGPMIDYDRDPDGWYLMYLSARDSRTHQYVYQFAHEYCHLLAHFDRKLREDRIERNQQWFEESLCETASLYALDRLSVSWSSADAGRDLNETAAELRSYLGQLLAEPHRSLASNDSLAAWYRRNRGSLERDPYLRELNELVAASLFPLFREHAGRWAALADLHPAEAEPQSTFAGLLADWRTAAPPETRPLIDEIQALFGL